MIVDGEKPTAVTISGRIEGQTRDSIVQPTREEFSRATGQALGGTAGFILIGFIGYFFVGSSKLAAVIAAG